MDHREKLDRHRLTQQEVETLNLIADEEYPSIYKLGGLGEQEFWIEVVRVDRVPRLPQPALVELCAMPRQRLEEIVSSGKGFFFLDWRNERRPTGRHIYVTKRVIEEILRG